MKYLGSLSILVAACIAQPAQGHDINLVYCNSLAGTKPSVDNSLTASTAIVGKFPGPKGHEKLNQPTGKPNELDTLSLHQVQGLENKFMRARFWNMGSGGVIADHCHEDRPAIVYLLEGSVHETKRTKNGGVVVNILKAGDNIAEGNGTRHWWINRGAENVTMFAVDFPSDAKASTSAIQGYPIPRANSHSKLVNQSIFKGETEFLDLEYEYPLNPERAAYIVQTRVTDVGANAVVGFENSTGLPSVSYIVSGQFLEWRSDMQQERSMGPKSHSALPHGVYNVWKNTGVTPGQIITIEVKRKD